MYLGKLVVFGESWLYLEKVVLFGQNGALLSSVYDLSVSKMASLFLFLWVLVQFVGICPRFLSSQVINAENKRSCLLT